MSKVYPDQLYFEKLVDSQSKLSQAGVQRTNMITCENNQLKTGIFVCLQISNVDTGYKKKIAKYDSLKFHTTKGNEASVSQQRKLVTEHIASGLAGQSKSACTQL